MTKQQKTLLVFDFDGTLCDSFKELLKAVNTIAPRYNLRSVDTDDTGYIRSLSSRQIFKHLNVRWYKLPFVIGRLRKIMKQQSSKLQLFDGVSDCIHQLKDHGFELAILSSNSKPSILIVLGEPLTQKFMFITGGCSPFKKAKKLLKIKAQYSSQGFQRIVYIGDETRDIKAAKASECYSVGVTWGYNDKNAKVIQNPKPK